MTIIKIDAAFEPDFLVSNKKSEVTLRLGISADTEKEHWCECDIVVNQPLSLAPDKPLNLGRTRVGILKKGRKVEKVIKLYMSPHLAPRDALVSITSYLYDEEGTIAERFDTSHTIKCEIAPPIR